MSTPPQSSFEKDFEEDYSPNQDSQDSSTSTSSSFYFSQWPIISKASGCLASLDIPRWHLQYPRPFSRRFVAVVFFAILSSFIGYTAYHAGHNYSLSSSSFPELTSLYSSNNNHHLPHIPPNIWQIYLEYSVEKMAEYKENIMSFVASSPTSQYSIIDEQGALSLLTKLSQRKKYADILSLFYAMPRRVTRADFLRYVVLALEGGVYSDIDTQMFKPLNEWVPEEHKNRTKLVVGIEFDQDGPGWGSFYPVTFAQWTIAAAPNHPALWNIVDRILEWIKKRPQGQKLGVDDDDVRRRTGPSAWTEIIYETLSDEMGYNITWHDLSGMKHPRLFGDILVLPIDAFGSGQEHSGSSSFGENGALVGHKFDSNWVGGDH